jgi:hypothetical protein
MDSDPLKEVAEQCQERGRLLREWTHCGRRVASFFDDHPVTMKSSESNSAGFEEQIRLAKAAETEAYRAYYRHVNVHDCV